MNNMNISCGIDRLFNKPELLDRNLKYGLLTNAASIDLRGYSAKQCLIQAGFHITRLYSPEHGMDAKGEDGQIQTDTIDEETLLPVTSLYGVHLKPSHGQDPGHDALIFDLPNVGARFYTYLWTMSLVMEWCTDRDMPLIILDRPNPLGGDLDKAEGPYIQSEFYSFIGRWNIPIRFSLTLGELAGLLKSEMKLESLSLQIIQVLGWSRNQTNKNYTYLFKAPSPALLSDHTLWTYPALCFLEATNISEGRNGPYSFEVAFAPFVHGQALESIFNSYDLQGIQAEFYKCTPAEGKYKSQSCEGIRLNVRDPFKFRPIYTGLILLAMILNLYPNQFAWNTYPTHVNPTGKNHFELLTGTRTVKIWLENQPLNHPDQLDILLSVPEWKARVESSLLYV